MMSYWSWWKEHNTNKEKTKHSEIPNMCGILGNDRDVALVDFEVTKLHLKQGGNKTKTHQGLFSHARSQECSPHVHKILATVS